MNYDDVPSARNFPGEEIPGATEIRMGRFSRGTPSEVVYEEGIYVGYRYFSTFDIPISYPFGYGLSYTEFSYQNLELSSTSFDGELNITLEITNAGLTAGKEVVQLYLSAPANEMDKPKIELKGFAKTRFLEPGGKQILTFSLDARDLSSFDQESSSWKAEPGKYTIKIGASSVDIKAESSFNLKEGIIVERTNRVLTPEREINEFTTTR